MPLTQQAQEVVDHFTATLNPERRRNFVETLRDAPGLTDEINAAVASRRLQAIVPLPEGINAGAQYHADERSMRIPLSELDSPRHGRRYDPSELVFAMSHECRHGSNARLMEQARSSFETDIGTIAMSRQSIHDYTQPLREILDAHRRDEATAHIAGYNALLSRVRTQHPPQPTLEQLYEAHPMRMQDFIERSNTTPPTYTPRAGLTLAPDLTITHTPGNIEAMGRYYFDRPASVANVGDHGLCDYRNLYGASYVGQIVQLERMDSPRAEINDAARVSGAPFVPACMAINMRSVGLDEAQMERQGLHLGPFQGFEPYLDSSQHPATWQRFHHTIEHHRHIAQANPTATPTFAPSSPSHIANHPAIERAREALDRSPNIGADAFGQDRMRVAAGVAVHAANQQLRPDHVVMNAQQTSLIAVQGKLGDPTALLSRPLAVAEARNTDLTTAQSALERLSPNDRAPALSPSLPAIGRSNPAELNTIRNA